MGRVRYITPEEKSLLLKDLCGRLPYGVMIYNSYKDPTRLTGIHYSETAIKISEASKEGPRIFNLINTCENCVVKPYLRPMESMTRAEREEYHSIVWDYHFINGDEDTIMLYEDFDQLNNFFNSHHLDFRGLIAKDLALPALPGMYRFDD